MAASVRVRVAAIAVLLGTLAAVAAGPLLAGSGADPGTRAGGPTLAAFAPLVGGFNAQVTWNGRDVASASSVSSAVQADFSSQVPIVFRWSAVGTPTAVSTARIQLMFFGSAVTTTDSVEQTPIATPAGAINMTWQVGSLRWLVAGSYILVASLISANASTIWSESFYLHLAAPYTVGAIVPALMILLGVMLLYEVAVSGRYAPSPETASLPSPESEAAVDGAPPTNLPEEKAGPP